jgi:hypothetical protein
MSTIENDPILKPPLKKRGRKPKNKSEEENNNKDDNETIYINNIDLKMVDNLEENDNLNIQNEVHVAKKRGRKPKGGKIIQQVVENINSNDTQQNVILHLKCFLKDLVKQPTNLMINEDIESFNFSNKQLYSNEFNLDLNVSQQKYNESHEYIEFDCEPNNKEVWKKIKLLEHKLHTNNISEKKSACFWCTYEFDNPPVYIPKYYLKDSYHVYGCFCSPECATAYLMEETIDSSSKFERYHLINTIYSKIFDYKKNIKPAPNPYYMLDKFYGNLSIQEYRSLLRNERLFLIVDKPLTRILPELHEDNDDFIINNTVIPSNTYQLKKKMQLKQPKTTILNENFGLAQY